MRPTTRSSKVASLGYDALGKSVHADSLNQCAIVMLVGMWGGVLMLRVSGIIQVLGKVFDEKNQVLNLGQSGIFTKFVPGRQRLCGNRSRIKTRVVATRH